MIKHLYHPICLALLISLNACQPPDFLPQDELQQYILEPSNGLCVEKKVGNIRVKVSYRPTDLMILQELRYDEEEKKFDKYYEKYDEYLYFVCQLIINGRDALYGSSPDQATFSDRLQTLSFRMDQFTHILTNQRDTIPLADFYYARNFGLSKSSDLLLVFNREKLEGADSFRLHLKEFGFGTGNLSFPFEWKAIQNTPHLQELQEHYENQDIKTTER